MKFFDYFCDTIKSKKDMRTYKSKKTLIKRIIKEMALIKKNDENTYTYNECFGSMIKFGDLKKIIEAEYPVIIDVKCSYYDKGNISYDLNIKIL